jgi:hypothetical protein
MASNRLWLTAFSAVASALLIAAEEIPKHQQEQIQKAAPDKPRVAPKKQRRVLIWNTPPHLYQNDAHKGYCILYGTCRVLYTGFGHRTELFCDPKLLQFYLDAIQFAAGDLEAPTAPR